MINKIFDFKSVLRIITIALLVYGAIYLYDHSNDIINGFMEGFNKHK